MKIISVVGARPNFMKIAPFVREIERHNISHPDDHIEHILVHTGQHYDNRMSDLFFSELNIPPPDINLGVGSGTHAEQVGQTMMLFEAVLKKEKPDWVVVVGDVNATLACSVTAKKEWVKCCHIEAGLRSGDMHMPEEINRLVTDRISDLLLTPDLRSNENLLNEGIPASKIKFVGNIMIDTLETNRERASRIDLNETINANIHEGYLGSKLNGLDLTKKIAVMTLHRPSNVDDEIILSEIIDFIINEVCDNMTLLWPIHPRTEKNLKQFKIWNKVLQTNNLILLRPLGYLEMLKLNMEAKIMFTDSGGLQEECTVLGTPCLTMRWNTERPITLREYGGASILVGNNIEQIRKEFKETLAKGLEPKRPELWDGKTASRCLQQILEYK